MDDGDDSDVTCGNSSDNDDDFVADEGNLGGEVVNVENKL